MSVYFELISLWEGKVVGFPGSDTDRKEQLVCAAFFLEHSGGFSF